MTEWGRGIRFGVLAMVMAVSGCQVQPLLPPPPGESVAPGVDAADAVSVPPPGEPDPAVVVSDAAAEGAGLGAFDGALAGTADLSPNVARDLAADVPADGPAVIADAALDRGAEVSPDTARDVAPDGPACRCLAANAGKPGVVVGPTEACPGGFGPDALMLGGDLMAPACTGCSCGRAPTRCAGIMYGWPTEMVDACLAAPPGTGGTGVMLETGQPCDTPFAHPLAYEFPSGFRLGPLTAKYQACAPRGQPTLARAAFRTRVRFCPALAPWEEGCAPGAFCLLPTGPRRCLLLPGGATCPAGTVRRGGDWFEGIDDRRRCGDCACGRPAGGDCAAVRAQVGNDIECDRPDQFYVAPGQKVCLRGLAAPYQPGIVLAGEPVKGRCTPEVTTTGVARGTGQHTLCCAR